MKVEKYRKVSLVDGPGRTITQVVTLGLIINGVIFVIGTHYYQPHSPAFIEEGVLDEIAVALSDVPE